MIIQKEYIEILKTLYKELIKTNIIWVLTGSLSFAIRGLDTSIGDIDIQTDKHGAYELQKIFKKYREINVEFKQTEKIRSYFGSIKMKNIKIEIMGDIEKKIKNEWTTAPDLVLLKENIEFLGMKIPVLPIEYEADAYFNMGRIDKANKLKELISSLKTASNTV